MIKRTVKSVIQPIQNWLLAQGKCVGCGTPLASGKASNSKNLKKVTCRCGRVYISDKNGNYRRALIEEV